MTWYLYKHPSGAAEVTDFVVPSSMRPDLVFIDSGETNPPNVMGMEFGPDNRLLPIVPEHITNRRAAYPTIGDQLDVLWKELGPSMKTPEAKEMYEQIKKVKEEYQPATKIGMAKAVVPKSPPPVPNFKPLPPVPVGPEPRDHPKSPQWIQTSE